MLKVENRTAVRAAATATTAAGVSDKDPYSQLYNDASRLIASATTTIAGCVRREREGIATKFHDLESQQKEITGEWQMVSREFWAIGKEDHAKPSTYFDETAEFEIQGEA